MSPLPYEWDEEEQQQQLFNIVCQFPYLRWMVQTSRVFSHPESQTPSDMDRDVDESEGECQRNRSAPSVDICLAMGKGFVDAPLNVSELQDKSMEPLCCRCSCCLVCSRKHLRVVCVGGIWLSNEMTINIPSFLPSVLLLWPTSIAVLPPLTFPCNLTGDRYGVGGAG